MMGQSLNNGIHGIGLSGQFLKIGLVSPEKWLK
jgi:hypothetical protein